MGLYKRGDSQFYWMSFVVNGRRVYESTKTKNKKLAEKRYAKRLTEIEEDGWFPAEVKRKTLRDMIDRYEAEYTGKKKHQARDRSIFKHLNGFFGEYILLKNMGHVIADYEAHRSREGARPATIVKELGLLRRMLNLASKRWRWVRDNPISLIEMPQVRNERVRYLSPVEKEMLFAALDDKRVPRWLKSIVVIALNTGLRESNILNLRWSQVNLFSSLLIIGGSEMKNQDSIGIPLTSEALDTLRELHKVKQVEGYVFHEEGRRIYARKLHRAFVQVCEIAGLRDFRFHDLRHTFASYLRQRGVDLHILAKLLGHRDLRMTQRYAHLSVENLRDAVSVLEDGYVSVTVDKKRGLLAP